MSSPQKEKKRTELVLRYFETIEDMHSFDSKSPRKFYISFMESAPENNSLEIVSKLADIDSLKSIAQPPRNSPTVSKCFSPMFLGK